MNQRVLVAMALTAVLFVPQLAAAHDEDHAGHGAAPAAPASKAIVAPAIATTYVGEKTPVGNGTVRTWVGVDRKGTPVSVGVTFSETALLGLPMQLPKDDIGWEWNLALPKEVAVAPFDHVAFYWNPRGHIPDGVYNVPHFDIHFFMVPEAQRAEITAMNYNLERCFKLPSQEYIPAGYILPPQTEHRRMGVHWIDPVSHEFHGHDFTATLLYGSYDGKVNFIEPMITRAFLETRPDFAAEVKQPAAYAAPGYYPTSYAVKFDGKNREYVVSLDGLTMRAGETTSKD
ncbi:MAG TPA: DUF5602 domain-containing protein [Candidatus Binatia bacterium]|nr:DUF5602 domain-containing protein [Candidatus Binatia bacterium]